MCIALINKWLKGNRNEMINIADIKPDKSDNDLRGSIQGLNKRENHKPLQKVASIKGEV